MGAGAVVGVMIGGAATSIGIGYGVEMTIGDKDYTRRDAAVDGVLGAVGFSAVKGAKSGYTAFRWARYGRKARHADEAIPINHKIWGESFAKYDAEVFEWAAKRDGLISAAHLVPLAIGSGIKVTGTRPGQPTVIDFGDRKITIIDPITSTHFGQISTSGGQSSKSTKVNGRPSNSKRSAKKVSQGRGKRPCRCKDGSYSVKCC